MNWTLLAAEWKTFVVPALSIGGSFLGAWLAARFALRRFYSEKLWERKTAAYTAIFEAIFNMLRWYDIHLTAYFRQREIGEEERTTLRSEYQAAKLILERRLASEVWLLPDACKARIDKMLKVLDEESDDDWFDMLDTDYGEIKNAMTDLTGLVRKDLRIRHV